MSRSASGVRERLCIPSVVEVSLYRAHEWVVEIPVTVLSHHG